MHRELVLELLALLVVLPVPPAVLALLQADPAVDSVVVVHQEVARGSLVDCSDSVVEDSASVEDSDPEAVVDTAAVVVAVATVDSL